MKLNPLNPVEIQGFTLGAMAKNKCLIHWNVSLQTATKVLAARPGKTG